ncbi:hypothetical protein Hanom_Chr14g01267111 [Helianthus anomalus]
MRFSFFCFIFFLGRHIFSLLFGRKVLPRKQLMVHGLITFKHAPLYAYCLTCYAPAVSDVLPRTNNSYYACRASYGLSP